MPESFRRRAGQSYSRYCLRRLAERHPPEVRALHGATDRARVEKVLGLDLTIGCGSVNESSGGTAEVCGCLRRLVL